MHNFIPMPKRRIPAGTRYCDTVTDTNPGYITEIADRGHAIPIVQNTAPDHLSVPIFFIIGMACTIKTLNKR